MTGESKRRLTPARRGEQASGGSPADRTLPPLSHRLSCNGRRRSRAVAALLLLWAAGSAGSVAAPVPGMSAVQQQLRLVEAQLRTECGCDSLRVVWKGSAALMKQAQGLDSLSCRLESAAALPGNGPGLSRITVRLGGRSAGRRVELLLGGEPFCFDTLLTATRAIRPGETLQKSDLARTAGWFALSPRAPERTPPPAPFALRGLSRGEPVRRGDLATVPAIRKGERLRMVYRAAGFSLEGQGIAREDAWPGAVTRVRLVGGSWDCQGLVLGRGLVAVGETAAE
jgi:hypothetical protein